MIATQSAIIMGSLDIKRRPVIKSRMTSEMESCSKATMHNRMGMVMTEMSTSVMQHMVNSVTENADCKNVWFVDSSASNHMTSHCVVQ